MSGKGERGVVWRVKARARARNCYVKYLHPALCSLESPASSAHTSSTATAQRAHFCSLPLSLLYGAIRGASLCFCFCFCCRCFSSRLPFSGDQHFHSAYSSSSTLLSLHTSTHHITTNFLPTQYTDLKTRPTNRQRMTDAFNPPAFISFRPSARTRTYFPQRVRIPPKAQLWNQPLFTLYNT